MKLNKHIADWKGRWALITGASSGMGREYALLMAPAGIHLILVARSEAALEDLAKECLAKSEEKPQIVVMDLSLPDAAKTLMNELKNRGLEPDILINNAGFGKYGPYLEGKAEDEENMIKLNVLALVNLSRACAEIMAKKNWGRILQVSSIAGYIPTPGYTVYGASKAFVLSYGISLNEELKNLGVYCTVLCPGVTQTKFFAAADKEVSKRMQGLMMSSEDVAVIGLNALIKKKANVVAGRANKLLMFLTRFVSKTLAARSSTSFE